MNSLILYGGGAIAVVLILSALPATKGLMSPIMAVLAYLSKVLAEHAGEWVVWIVKRIWSDHIILFRNLVYTADDLDKSVALRY